MLSKLVLGIIMGAVIGALLGYVGQTCQGSCPLLKNPKRGAVYGALWGLAVIVLSYLK